MADEAAAATLAPPQRAPTGAADPMNSDPDGDTGRCDPLPRRRHEGPNPLPGAVTSLLRRESTSSRTTASAIVPVDAGTGSTTGHQPVLEPPTRWLEPAVEPGQMRRLSRLLPATEMTRTQPTLPQRAKLFLRRAQWRASTQSPSSSATPVCAVAEGVAGVTVSERQPETGPGVTPPSP